MLNELRRVSQAFIAAGIEVPVQDDRFRTYGDKLTFIAFLGSDGEVARLRYEHDRKVVAALMKFEASTGGSRPSTPGFNVPAIRRPQAGKAEPYRELLKDLVKTKERSKRQELVQQLAAISELNWEEKRDNITKCLRPTSRSLLEEILASKAANVDAAKPTIALLERLQRLDGNVLERELAEVLRRQVTDAGPYETPDQAARLLFQKDGVIVFDVSDPASFGGFSAHHPAVQAAVKKAVREKRQAA